MAHKTQVYETKNKYYEQKRQQLFHSNTHLKMQQYKYERIEENMVRTNTFEFEWSLLCTLSVEQVRRSNGVVEFVVVCERERMEWCRFSIGSFTVEGRYVAVVVVTRSKIVSDDARQFVVEEILMLFCLHYYDGRFFEEERFWECWV